jgi:F-type H+/Na+-transporting ATPase subunit alpha
MAGISDDLKAWLPRALDKFVAFKPGASFNHVGVVQHVGDGVATVKGLPWTRLDELLRFEDGTIGLALTVDIDEIGCILLGGDEGISAGAKVYGTGEIARVPVGGGLLGRIIDPLGNPLDDGLPVKFERHDPIDRPAPAIIDRDPVTEPLMTGLTVIDTMIPLGRGQRELIIGDRKTGKTSIAVDAMINQRSSDVICVYAAIGQKAATIGEVVGAIRKHGAIERCIFVIGQSEAPAGAQWMTPYSACTIAEYFRDQGRHVMLVIDDLTKHAIVYRQLSLLLRRPPGREAYPGDIFYIHARLLERAAKLSKDSGGGSLTALPIAETQAGDLSAYIPTNLISITDGQICLEPKLFYQGQKPAVNVGLSVSRVGGQAQAPIIKSLAGKLRLDYAQFVELEIFTRFGAMVDDRTKKTIERGRRIRAILTQPSFRPVTLTEQAALLLGVNEGRLDGLDPDAIDSFKSQLGATLASRCPQIAVRVDTTGTLTDADRASLLDVIGELAAGVALKTVAS